MQKFLLARTARRHLTAPSVKASVASSNDVLLLNIHIFIFLGMKRTRVLTSISALTKTHFSILRQSPAVKFSQYCSRSVRPASFMLIASLEGKHVNTNEPVECDCQQFSITHIKISCIHHRPRQQSDFRQETDFGATNFICHPVACYFVCIPMTKFYLVLRQHNNMTPFQFPLFNCQLMSRLRAFAIATGGCYCRRHRSDAIPYISETGIRDKVLWIRDN